ncbi:fimbrial protein [Serratia sp. NPDC078593]|uniref:fimbrial protein n=1 Tax=unclassified Serratia (in: enterobacteria) TaxID=2647522 RepID=UPI0037CD0B6F
MMKHVLWWLALLLASPAQAIYLSSSVFTLESDQTFFSRQFVNNTKNTNLYVISAYRIDQPGRDEQPRPLEEGEILYTPLRKILEPGAWEYFKIFYRGPADDRERYYRIVIKEIPANAMAMPSHSKAPLVSPIVALDTIFVVRPRQMRFTYHYDPQAGVLKNTGNTYFRVMIHPSCDAQDDSAKVFNLLPGESYRGADLRGQQRKFIIGFNKYLRLGEQCFGALDDVR